MKLSRLKVGLAIASIFVSCCLCVYVLELITSELPGAGNIITLAQFLFISLEGLIFTTKFLTKRRSVPLRDYLILVIMFFLVSVSNNYALGFNISMPLHMIFKSGSLIANMMLGIMILKRRYSFSKFFAVTLISIGIATCTIASTQSYANGDATAKNNAFAGICLLMFSLIASARMGIYQETIAQKYGKHTSESLFYCHALPLPGFLILFNDIRFHAEAFNRSAPIVLPLIFFEYAVPKHWVYLLLIAMMQYACARSVFTLTNECSSLTVTLVITLRKFLSLIVSIVYFKNPFTIYHWIGATLVFIGTFVFVNFPFNYLRSGREDGSKKIKSN